MTVTRNRIAISTAVAAIACAWTAHEFHRVGEVQVTSAPITKGSIVHAIVATGTLEPVAAVQVGAQVSGTIDALYADYNSIVHKGQILAKLETAQLDAALAGAQAVLDQAQAALAQSEAARAGFETAARDARTKMTRQAELAARDLVAAADLDAARSTLDQAVADLQSGEAQIAAARGGVVQARAQVEQAKTDRDHAVITSPIDGIVVARNVDVGQTVTATVQAPVLFDIAADFQHMQVEVDVDESDIGGIRTGTPATFEVEAFPDTFVGTIVQVRVQPVAESTTTATMAAEPMATPTTIASVVGYATIIAVANPDAKLRPGMTATVTLPGSRADDALRIPNAALSFRPPRDVLAALGQPLDSPAGAAQAANDSPLRRVWRFDGAAFTPVDVRTGVSDGQMTEVLGGTAVNEGELVVTSAKVASDDTPQ